jgi:hypothetical protein
MKKLLIGLGLLASLGGCTTLSNVESFVSGSGVSANDVYIAANSFDAVQSSAKIYIQLPLCATGGPVVCRTQANTVAVDKAIRAGRNYRNTLEAFVTANPGKLVPISNYSALLATISQIQTYVGASK